VRWRPSLALAVVTGLLGFLLVTAAFSARDVQRAAVPRKTQLVQLIGQRRSQEADLEQAIRALRQQILDAERRSASTDKTQRAAADRAAQLAAQAGTTALQGRALIVKLRDSNRPPQASGDAGAYLIHDSDLQLVVNALFAAGAEAVSVNDNRIVATSPIRAAGATIVVNFRPLTPPYRVVGIGADQPRFEASEIVRRFHQWTTQYGLGFSVSSGDAAVPAYAGRVDISSAQAVTPTTATPTISAPTISTPTTSTPTTSAPAPPAPAPPTTGRGVASTAPPKSKGT
jgi:uncharacterized protein YlxW (UPF0749 family)